MVRTKHLVLVLGASALVLSGAGFALFTSDVTRGEAPAVSFSVPRDAYLVFREEHDVRTERRSAFIASVREALQRDPVSESEPEPEPVLPQEPEEIRVAVPQGYGVWSYGDATLAEEPAPAPVLLPPTPATTSTSTQGEDVPTFGAGVQ